MSHRNDYQVTHRRSDARRMRDESPRRMSNRIEMTDRSVSGPKAVTTYKVSTYGSPRSPRNTSLTSSFHDEDSNQQPRPMTMAPRSPSFNTTPEPHQPSNRAIDDDPEIFIMVMGMTGSGKSSFINLLSDRPVQVGHSLTSCTTEPEVCTVPLSKERREYLIDTPGFDDTSRPDEDVLKSIAHLLNVLYQKGKRLSAVIYMHRITDVRMSGGAVKNLDLFRKICGRDAFPHIALVSSMWEMLKERDGHRSGVQREDMLLGDWRFWKDFKEGGSRIMRHEGTVGSARDIIRNIPFSRRGLTLDLQKEMGNGSSLDETTAGMFLQRGLLHLKRKYEQSLRQLQKEIDEARADGDDDGEEMLRGEHKMTITKIRQADKGVKALNVDAEDLSQEKGAVYRDNVDVQMQREIAEDPVLEQEVAEMQRLKEEISYLKSLDGERTREIELLRRNNQAWSNAYHHQLQQPRNSSSSSTPQHLSKLEHQARKKAANIDQILLEKGSPVPLVRSFLDATARIAMNGLRKRSLQRSLTEPSMLARNEE